MGKIPIIVKDLPNDELNYEELTNKQSKLSKDKIAKDCMHVYLFIPSKLKLKREIVFKDSCPKSNYSFDNKLSNEVFYFLYGRECVVNEHQCEDS